MINNIKYLSGIIKILVVLVDNFKNRLKNKNLLEYTIGNVSF